MGEEMEWDLMGDVESNKVKYMGGYMWMIEWVESVKVVKEIEKEGGKEDGVVKVVVEVDVGEEDRKWGVWVDGWGEVVEGGEWGEMKDVEICGMMMGMRE